MHAVDREAPVMARAKEDPVISDPTSRGYDGS